MNGGFFKARHAGRERFQGRSNQRERARKSVAKYFFFFLLKIFQWGKKERKKEKGGAMTRRRWRVSSQS